MKNFNTNDFNYEEVCNFISNDFFHYSGSVKKSKSMKFLIDGETYRLSVSVKERDYIKIEKKGENGYETIKEKKARINQITLLVAQDMLWIVLNNIVAVKEEKENINQNNIRLRDMKVTGFNIGTREGKLKAAARDLREAVVNNGYSSIIDLGGCFIVDIIRPYFKHSYTEAINWGPGFMKNLNDIITQYNKMYETNESI